MNEVKDSAPGKDQMRIRYIKGATGEISVIELVQNMFETRPTTDQSPWRSAT